MKAYLSHKSALEFWRSNYACTHTLARSRTQSTRSSTSNAREIKAFETWRFGVSEEPIHVMVDSQNKRCSIDAVQAHLAAEAMPTGSFCMLEKDLFVASPELCFLLAARKLSFIELVKLGYEFCGSYCLSDLDARGFVKRDPITSAHQLKQYLKKASSMKSADKALRAAKLVLDNSASPMETAIAMILCTPCRYGGYGLPPARLNYRIDLSEEAQRMSGRRYFVCDFYWPPYRVAVEYDSDHYHTAIERINADAIRRDVLGYCNITVITVTNARARSEKLLHETALLVAKAIGHRMQIRCKDWPSKHATLRNVALN